jgi:hypothetical protein
MSLRRSRRRTYHLSVLLVNLLVSALGQPEKYQQMLTNPQIRSAKRAEKPWKVADCGGLHLLVAPNGGRYWRYNYRFNGKQKTLAMGVYPDVTLNSRDKPRGERLRGAFV